MDSVWFYGALLWKWSVVGEMLDVPMSFSSFALKSTSPLPPPIILSDWLSYGLLNNAPWNNHSWLDSCNKPSHKWRVQKV